MALDGAAVEGVTGASGTSSPSDASDASALVDGRQPQRSSRQWLLGPVLLLVVVGAALLVGSGVFSSAPTTAAQRARALETQIRCPSCVDVSVADSSAATAASLRQQILHWEQQGLGDQRIEDILVSRYGPTILLTPPSSGWGSLLWIVPVAAGGIALAALGVFFWRRNQQFEGWRRDASNPGTGEPA